VALINDILDFSRSMRGRMVVQTENFAVNLLVKDVVRASARWPCRMAIPCWSTCVMNVTCTAMRHECAGVI
jgi:hypothetical protein